MTHRARLLLAQRQIAPGKHSEKLAIPLQIDPIVAFEAPRLDYDYFRHHPIDVVIG
jgi:hypothetical protein